VIGSQLRPVVGRVADPLVNRLLAWGVTPDAVTATGTLGVVAAALVFYPGGHFFVGTLVITFFVLTDTIDGALARKRGISSRFGAWLDSTCDRVADGAVFGGLALWYAGRGDDDVLLAVTLFVLVSSLVVSYEKARAEGLGMTCDVGIAERPERLIIVLAAAGLVGLGVPDVLLAGALWLLAVLSAVTLVQRLREVKRQATVTSEPA
jgi:CDP-diacylglycerol--glycerol-3-phosphate 3-phosphatidyltransferase